MLEQQKVESCVSQLFYSTSFSLTPSKKKEVEKHHRLSGKKLMKYEN